MKNQPKIYICTPSFNSAETIEQTILSVINQKGNFELYYHVQDGGSKDCTLDILKRYSASIEKRKSDNPKIHFSFESTNDNGMYNAIVKGFTRFEIPSNSWMTWINSDDQLEPDALSYISGIDASNIKNVNWIGGQSSVILESGKHIHSFQPLNADIINTGVVDGLFWGFVQQEGMFFRQSLWDKIDLKNNFANFKYAGDWSLWREFSKHEIFYQVDKILGNFYKRKGQLSEVNRGGYMEEVDFTISESHRRDLFLKIQKQSEVRYELTTDYHLIEKSILPAIQYWQQRRKKEDLMKNTIITENIIAYDNHWQFPAITEQHAFNKLKEYLYKTSTNVIYFAFPWATLIDLLNNNKDKGAELEEILYSFKEQLKNKKVITTCQHIHMLKYQCLFDKVGITDIFWTHKVAAQDWLPDYESINIHPFPLYPVQAIDTDESKETSILERKYLFSFVGAKANRWYLTQSRTHILDLLSGFPNSKVIGRDSWHYNKTVYEHQIHNEISSKIDLVDKDTSEEFKQILNDSIFSLCPSGSGPNSIRLWESIGCGVIPVILADSYQPPGNQKLWNEAVVYSKEDSESIKQLPGVLAEIAKDKELLTRKRHALKQLWLLYGPDCFVYDILKEFLNNSPNVLYKFKSLKSLKSLVDDYESGKCTKEMIMLSCVSKLLIDADNFFLEYTRSDLSKQSVIEIFAEDNKYFEAFNKTLLLKHIELI
ncbi:exostosin family protein [Thalassotalea psychrophila]|uniref:Exostosin family protein n=1 Tax=Thalassotalea psychrophila TaxID=3065647 RepID=A0ABY9TR44_9GAMM|nr:exostosin family protein [Colwelliaceae bacterium SQ149]